MKKCRPEKPADPKKERRGKKGLARPARNACASLLPALAMLSQMAMPARGGESAPAEPDITISHVEVRIVPASSPAEGKQVLASIEFDCANPASTGRMLVLRGPGALASEMVFTSESGEKWRLNRHFSISEAASCSGFPRTPSFNIKADSTNRVFASLRLEIPPFQAAEGTATLALPEHSDMKGWTFEYKAQHVDIADGRKVVLVAGTGPVSIKSE